MNYYSLTKDDSKANFCIDNKDLVETYGESSEMVDTRKLESISGAKSLLKGISEDLYIENNGVYILWGRIYKQDITILKNY